MGIPTNDPLDDPLATRRTDAELIARLQVEEVNGGPAQGGEILTVKWRD